MDCSTPGLSVHHQLLELTQTHVHWVGDVIQPFHLLFSPSPPAFNLSQHQGLFNWASIRWPKYWSFSFSITPSNEHPGLISFRIDWLDLLAVQGTVKSLLQHHSSKSSVLQHSSFFTVQLSHPYMTTGKTIALTRQNFLDKVMSLLYHILSRYIILEKEMATHSSVLAWRIPGTGEPGGLPSMGSHRVGHDWSDLAAVAAIVSESNMVPGTQQYSANISRIFRLTECCY